MRLRLLSILHVNNHNLVGLAAALTSANLNGPFQFQSMILTDGTIHEPAPRYRLILLDGLHWPRTLEEFAGNSRFVTFHKEDVGLKPHSVLAELLIIALVLPQDQRPNPSHNKNADNPEPKGFEI
jgi:hypothetical protein